MLSAINTHLFYALLNTCSYNLGHIFARVGESGSHLKEPTVILSVHQVVDTASHLLPRHLLLGNLHQRRCAHNQPMMMMVNDHKCLEQTIEGASWPLAVFTAPHILTTQPEFSLFHMDNTSYIGIFSAAFHGPFLSSSTVHFTPWPIYILHSI